MSVESQSKGKVKHLKLSEFPGLIKDTVLSFFEKEGLFHGAALAYYTLFAIIPLIYLSISFLGRIIGQDLMLDIIADVLRHKVGIKDIAGIMDFMKELNFDQGNFFMEMVSIIALIISSSAFVVCLKQSINDFFGLHVSFATRKRRFFKTIGFRLLSIVFVAILTILIIVLYFAQTLLMSASDSLFASHSVVNSITSNILQHGFAIFSNFIIFTMVFKYVHDGIVQWKLAMGGALVTAVMLYVGQLLIKYYLFHFFFAASVGITGSFFIILAWVYYSSQIIFYGAKFTAEYARRIDRPIQFRH